MQKLCLDLGLGVELSSQDVTSSGGDIATQAIDVVNPRRNSTLSAK